MHLSDATPPCNDPITITAFALEWCATSSAPGASSATITFAGVSDAICLTVRPDEAEATTTSIWPRRTRAFPTAVASCPQSATSTHRESGRGWQCNAC